MALELRKPLIPLRKPGKLPYATHCFSTIWNTDRPNCTSTPTRLPPGSRVLLVDDVLATGGTMAAACQLIEQAGGTVAGCAVPDRTVVPEGPRRCSPATTASA